MKICGFQKLTVLDYPGKAACIVFLGGCNLRCPYCHNSELIEDRSLAPAISEEEFFAFLAMRKGILDGVVISGGEPLIHSELGAFIREIKDRGYLVKIDTNGTFPERLKKLCDEGLIDYVAMDVKSGREGYPEAAGTDGNIQKIDESIRFLIEAGRERGLMYEFRTTVVKELHDAATMESIGRWISGAKRHYIQPFTDRDTVPYGNLHSPDEDELKGYTEILKSYVERAEIRGI